MTERFTPEEQSAWADRQPKKLIVGKTALLRPDGRVLVLKPNYKPSWGFPGGVVEENESPLNGALREMEEEIHLELAPERLGFLALRHGMSRTTGREMMHVLFRAEVTDEEVASMVLDPDESDDMSWIDPNQVTQYITESIGQLAQRRLTDPTSSMYSENDEFYV